MHVGHVGMLELLDISDDASMKVWHCAAIS